jgi:anti-anti-sigma regulatory factor
MDEIAIGDHACVVVDSDEQHWDVAAGYVAAGLALGQKVLYFDAARSSHPLLRRLRDENIDVAQHRRTGQLTLVPPDQSSQLWKFSASELVASLDEAITQALNEGYPGLRITDEPPGAADRPAGHSMTAADRAIDQAMRGRPVTLLCQYDRAHAPSGELDELCEQHALELVAPSLYDDGLLRITRTAPFTTRVSGEIDFSNRHLVRGIIDKELDRALRTASQTAEIEVHLESLRFADVTSIVQFAQAAAGFPQSHRLVLYGLRPALRRVLDRCGAGFVTQLTLREPEAR